jgi:predicted O-methyltransferase YrrM
MINTHFCKSFIKHYWSATRIDVLHSPFVFDLYNNCVKKTSDPDFEKIENLRIQLKHDQRVISQEDLGAGSAQQKTKQETVAYFARRHAKPARIAQIIYQLVKHYRFTKIIELGTSLGISACYEASAIDEGMPVKFTTIEGAPAIATIAAENFRQLHLDKKILQRTGNFDDVLPEVLKDYNELDMAFIDGNHRYEPTLKYFEQLLPYMLNNSVLIFDDIYWSKGMTEAWEKIKQHPEVTVTVDLFFIGLVFFRKEQAREHFKLRIF